MGKAALALENPTQCPAQREQEQQIRFSLGSFQPLELDQPCGDGGGSMDSKEGWDKERGISLRGLG